MVRIEALIQSVKLDAVKAAIDSLGVGGITFYHVMDHGGPSGLKAFYRGVEYAVDSPRVKLEMVVSSLQADEVIEALSEAARTGMSGDDGMIVVTEVADAMRIKNGRRFQVAFS